MRFQLGQESLKLLFTSLSFTLNYLGLGVASICKQLLETFYFS